MVKGSGLGRMSSYDAGSGERCTVGSLSPFQWRALVELKSVMSLVSVAGGSDIVMENSHLGWSGKSKKK